MIRAGTGASVRSPLAAVLAGSLCGAIAGMALDGVPAAVVGAVAGIWLASALRRMQADRAVATLDAQVGAAADLLARSLAAQASLTQACAVCAARLPAPLGPQFAAAAAAAAAGRQRPGAALVAAAAGAGSSSFRLLASVLAGFEQRGGPVVAALRRTASIARDRRALSAERRAALSQSRASAAVIAMLPVVARVVLPETAPLPWPLALAGWGLTLLGLVLLWRLGGRADQSATARSQRRAQAGLSGPPAFAGAGGRCAARLGALAPRVALLERRTVQAIGAPAAAGHAGDGVRGLRMCAAVGAVGIVVGVGAGAAVAAVAALGAGVGVDLIWRHAIDDRRRRTEAAVADCCDLLAVRFAAGANLHAAITGLGSDVDGPLGAAIAAAVVDISAGARPDDALVAHVGPLGCDDADEIVAGLAEVRRSGGAAADTFAALAADARLRQRLDVTTRLRRLPVIGLVPLVGCVLPAFVLLVVTPMLGAVLAGSHG